MTQEQVLERVQQLRAKGWTVLPSDDLARGMRGYLVIRDAVEEILEWPMFDQPLVPDVQIVNPLELKDFLAESPEALLCDDLERLLLGFVRYDPSEGKAIVRQTRLTSLRSSASEVKASILSVRDALFVKAESDRKERLLSLTHLSDCHQ